MHVVIDRFGIGRAAVAQDAVFAMEENVAAIEIVGNKGRDAQAEVDVAVFG